MKWVEGVANLKHPPRGTAVTLGSFDGVHCGHRQLIDRALQRAQALALSSCVFTFHPHPRKVLDPGSSIIRLFDEVDQMEQLEEMGVDLLIQEPFSLELAKLSPDEFFDHYLCEALKMKALVVGYDFAFGAERAGDQKFLEDYCARKDIELHIVKPVSQGDQVISSTRIREALREGDVSLATELLGRPFYLKGLVCRGAGRGRILGFPTANIMPETEILPRSGVYATRTRIGSKKLASVTNIGTNPTFEKDPDRPIKVESFVLDWNQDLYDQEIRVELVAYLREEQSFTGTDELKTQIAADIRRAQEILQ